MILSCHSVPVADHGGLEPLQRFDPAPSVSWGEDPCSGSSGRLERSAAGASASRGVQPGMGGPVQPGSREQSVSVRYQLLADACLLARAHMQCVTYFRFLCRGWLAVENFAHCFLRSLLASRTVHEDDCVSLRQVAARTSLSPSEGQKGATRDVFRLGHAKASSCKPKLVTMRSALAAQRCCQQTTALGKSIPAALWAAQP